MAVKGNRIVGTGGASLAAGAIGKRNYDNKQAAEGDTTEDASVAEATPKDSLPKVKRKFGGKTLREQQMEEAIRMVKEKKSARATDY